MKKKKKFYYHFFYLFFGTTVSFSVSSFDDEITGLWREKLSFSVLKHIK